LLFCIPIAELNAGASFPAIRAGYEPGSPIDDLFLDLAGLAIVLAPGDALVGAGPVAGIVPRPDQAASGVALVLEHAAARQAAGLPWTPPGDVNGGVVREQLHRAHGSGGPENLSRSRSPAVV
jgi:hypothetical protein